MSGFYDSDNDTTRMQTSRRKKKSENENALMVDTVGSPKVNDADN